MIPESITIDISLDDLAASEGQAGVYNRCPAALALTRQGFTQIDVDEDRALLTQVNERLYAKTPRNLSIFIEDFDNNQPVKAGTFTFVEIRLATIKDERSKQTLDDDILSKYILDDEESLDIDEENGIGSEDEPD